MVNYPHKVAKKTLVSTQRKHPVDFANRGMTFEKMINESNQELLARFKQVDFVKYAYPHYSNPGQLKEYNQFLIDNADGAYVFYDPENETNLKYLYKMMLEKEPFYVKQLSFDDLNELAENFYEN